MNVKMTTRAAPVALRSGSRLLGNTASHRSHRPRDARSLSKGYSADTGVFMIALSFIARSMQIEP